MNEMKRYVFIKNYNTTAGVIHEGRTIDLVHGCVFLDGGMLDKYNAAKMMEIIENKEMRDEYLVEKVIPINKV